LFTQLQKPLRLGLIIGIGRDPEAAIAKVDDLGLPTCQVYVEDFAAGVSTRLLQALDKHHIEATSVVVGGPGREAWDFYEGPLTIGWWSIAGATLKTSAMKPGRKLPLRWCARCRTSVYLEGLIG